MAARNKTFSVLKELCLSNRNVKGKKKIRIYILVFN